jgi:acetyl-CoA C-acetyltransferase
LTNPHGIRDRVAIVGMGCTQFGELWDKSTDDLLLDACGDAMASVGVGVDQVEAFWVGTLSSGNAGTMLSRPLRLQGKPVSRVENLCASGSESLRSACFAVAAGMYDTALVVGVEKLKDSGFSGLVVPKPPNEGPPEVTAPSRFSLLVPAYAEKYCVDSGKMRETLTHIAWKNHQNGSKNQRAQFRKPISKEAISAAPRVAGSLGVFDCSGVADGAAAALVVPAEHAYRYTSKPLYVKALSLVAGDCTGHSDATYDFTTFPEVVSCARQAYQQAGVVDPKEELALAEVHDCFTPTELILMEDLGFAERGSAWRDVLQGDFDLGGRLPVNPDGGLKAFGHPVGASGLRMLFECWLQLRNEAPAARQIATVGQGRTLGLTHNLGGMPGECVSFVGIVGSEPS